MDDFGEVGEPGGGRGYRRGPARAGRLLAGGRKYCATATSLNGATCIVGASYACGIRDASSQFRKTVTA